MGTDPIERLMGRVLGDRAEGGKEREKSAGVGAMQWGGFRARVRPVHSESR